MRILEEFWYGNIEPNEYDISSKEYKKLLELICRNEDKLRATMTDEQKELFERFDDCYADLTDINEREVFAYAFRLGGKIATEIMKFDVE